MLYDVAVMIPEAMTAELTGTLMDEFSYAGPSVARNSNPRQCELYLTYDAHDLIHALRIVVDGMDGIADIASVTIDVIAPPSS